MATEDRNMSRRARLTVRLGHSVGGKVEPNTKASRVTVTAVPAAANDSVACRAKSRVPRLLEPLTIDLRRIAGKVTDRRAINITLNSLGTELNKGDRKKLYPSFGKLYPEGTLMLSRAEDFEGVRLAVEGVSDYKSFFDAAGLGGGPSGDQSTTAKIVVRVSGAAPPLTVNVTS